jgi:adenylate cyclase
MIKKILLSPWLALITLVLMLSIRIADPNFVESVRLRYFDTLIAGKEKTVNNIYTVNVDEAALEKLGQWPLPRNQYADIIQDLYERNAGLVVFNVLMPEYDRGGMDDVLAETMLHYPVILPNIPADRTRNEPRNPGASILGPEYLSTVIQYPGIVSNVPQLEQNAIGVGITNTLPEIDGVNRRVPMVVAVGDTLYPNMSLEVLRVIAGDPSFQIKLNPMGVEKMRIPQFGTINTDSLGRVWVDWSQTGISVSLTELPDDFAGAVVIVGVSAAGLGNPLPTAIGSVWPQDMQAALIGTMFNDVNIQRADWADGLEILVMLFVGLVIILLCRWVYVGLAVTILILSSSVFVSQHFFRTENMLVDPTATLFALMILALHVYGVKFVSEYLQKQAIKKQFAGYCSPTVVRMLQENPKLIKEGMKREISICFSDLRGFTPLGESFGDDVKGLTKLMNRYMDAITQPVLQADGMIIKYIGDASMHVHNAPNEDLNHAKSAVCTGLNMLTAVEKFNAEITAEGRPPIGMGAGINTGLGYLGEMGSSARHSYDVLGDAVSTAARIESKCKEYGCLLLVGENTVKQCDNEFFFLKIDDLAVKGKSVGVGIYTVLCEMSWAKNHEDWMSAYQLHAHMHQLYRDQNFDGAAELCTQLMNKFDGKMKSYYEMWIERCEFQKTQNLGPNWNGVFIAQSK